MRQFNNNQIKNSLINKLKAQITHYQGIISIISQPGNAPEKEAVLKSHGSKHPVTITRTKQSQIADLNYLMSIAQMDEEDFEQISKDLHLFISDGNKKTGPDVMTFSIFSGITCPYATPRCLKICYDLKMYWRFSILFSRARNTLISLLPEELLYQRFRKELQEKKQRILRIHEGGEYYNIEYATKMDKICSRLIKEGVIDIAFGYTKNIHYMPLFSTIRTTFSIMEDTPPEFIQMAEESDCYTFTAVPKKVGYSDMKERCVGDCSKCSFCYGNRKHVELIEH